MSTKELAMETIKGLPENASWQDIEERILFLSAIEKSRDEVRRGDVVPHEEISDLLNEWITE
jgi:predicted transcriptional regulator